MIRTVVVGCWLALTAACGEAGPARDVSSMAPSPLKSGYEFLTPETQALQTDAFANPGFLWVDRGAVLFADAREGSPACASCHEANGEALQGVAAHYPAVDETSGRLLNLEGRINTCRERHQKRDRLDYESDDLLALTAYVAGLSRGAPIAASVGGPAAKYAERGRDYFYTRRGQFNISCNQCHNDYWGQKLRGDTISQGHGNGFPAYRLEWQSIGSLHRRFRDCDAGVRAEPLEYGSDTYVALELYLASRAEGLLIETPAVRR